MTFTIHSSDIHNTLIHSISNATFVLDDGEQEQAHEMVNLSLNMSLIFLQTRNRYGYKIKGYIIPDTAKCVPLATKRRRGRPSLF